MSDELNATDARVRAILDRLHRLDDDKAAVAADRKEVLSEAKANGYEPKILNRLVKIERQDRAKAAEEQALVETYAAAAGVVLP